MTLRFQEYGTQRQVEIEPSVVQQVCKPAAYDVGCIVILQGGTWIRLREGPRAVKLALRSARRDRQRRRA